MKTFILALFLALAGTLLSGAVAWADAGPHGNFAVTEDGCARCHRAHTAQGTKLLKTDRTTLCFSCHDGTGSTLDAWDGASLTAQIGSRATGGNPAGITGALRAGGFVYARINSSNAATPGVALVNTVAGALVSSAHVKFGLTAGTDGNALTPKNTMWGNGAISGTANAGLSLTTALACTDCHNPHGGANSGAATYRILRPVPLGSGATTGVALGEETPTKIYTTANYWNTYQGGTTTALPWGTAAAISNWCSQCHTRYQAGASSGTTSSGDAVFKYRHRSDGNASMGGKTGAPYGVNVYTAECLQCHVAHGGNASMGTFSQAVPWPNESPGRGAESALLKIDNRGTCVACHGTSP